MNPIWILSMMVLDVIYSGTLFIMFPDIFEQKTAFMGDKGGKVIVDIEDWTAWLRKEFAASGG